MRRWFLAIPLLFLAGCGPAGVDDLGPVGDFAFTERSGAPVTQADLRGKVWVASFVFVRCTSHCPQISRTVRELQSDLRDVKDLRFVTFTVDPTHDREAELREYADAMQADPDRWLFLTGTEEAVRRMLVEQFKVGGTLPGDEPGQLMHSTRLVVVDRDGKIRGYFDGMAPAAMVKEEGAEAARTYEAEQHAKLRQAVRSLAAPGWDFPFFHAVLNTVATGLLVVGWIAIRSRAVRVHIASMVTTLAISALFLTSYLYYHLVIKGSVATRFQDQNPDAPEWVRYVYYAILLTHTILAVVVTPLAVWTAYLGWKGDYGRHRPLAKWVLPVWLYVTTTGVVVYVMLYRMYAPT